MSLQKEVESFQRDMELIEIEYRKKVFSGRFYKWLEKREKRKRGKKNDKNG